MRYLFLRVSLGVVFVIFGLGKFQNDIWAQTIKAMDIFMKLPWNVNLSVFLIGTVETLTGVALIIGLFPRIFAAIAALQLTGILILLKFGEVRDIGLLGMAIYMALSNNDSFSVCSFWKKRKDK